MTDTPAPSVPRIYVQEFPLDPHALAALTENGSCSFELPETLFDKDFPGHYQRKIRSVSLTIHCVARSHADVTAELTLISSKVRTSPKTSAGSADFYYDDRNFTTSFPSKKSKATSSRPTGSRTFVLDFQGEGYLPFERQGAISRWSLRMPQQEGFDFSTISDVVIRLSYTARDGGAPGK